jgi:hypothetical protein
MPDFLAPGSTHTLRPGASDVPFRWRFAAESAAGANDGALPFGTTIASAVVKLFNHLGVDVSDAVLLTPPGVAVVGGLIVTASLKHPGAVAHTVTKTYTAVLALTLSTGAVLVFEAKRIKVDPTAG